MTNGVCASGGSKVTPTTLNFAITTDRPGQMTIRREDLEQGRIDLSDVIDARRAAMKPVHPGEVLKHEFLDPLGVSAYRLAKDISVPINRVAAIVSGRRAVTA